MSQVNRQIKDSAALDDVDHALGRPFDPFDTYRDHYATCCPDQAVKFRASPWWREGITRGEMTFFHVSDAGRKALADELANPAQYGRVFEITARRHDGSSRVVARSHSQARYKAFIHADLDWSFMDYCKEVRVRLASVVKP